jgi:Ner family transcriptional regulator
MNTSATLKNIAPDWHRADIVAALHKRGWSLRRLALQHGYKSPGALGNELDRPWPKGERLIAAAIGTAPETIWPSRYQKRKFTPVLTLPLVFDRSDTNLCAGGQP